MTYNLGFKNNTYTNGVNNFGNTYNPNIFNPYNNNIYESYANMANETQERIKNLQKQITSNTSQSVLQNTPQSQQPYVIVCGKKEDWDEFLMINYGITEQHIFNDYKLFLQAKQEILDEQGQTKLNNMKDKIRGNVTNNVIDNTVKSNVKPNNFNTNSEQHIDGCDDESIKGQSKQESKTDIKETKSATSRKSK